MPLGWMRCSGYAPSTAMARCSCAYFPVDVWRYYSILRMSLESSRILPNRLVRRAWKNVGPEPLSACWCAGVVAEGTPGTSPVQRAGPSVWSDAAYACRIDNASYHRRNCGAAWPSRVHTCFDLGSVQQNVLADRPSHYVGRCGPG